MYMTQTRKKITTKGWSKLAPKTKKQRTSMLKKCGRKCFLGPKKSFPICTKGTCKINPKGVLAAYSRARQWGKSKSTYKTSKPRHSRKTYDKIQRKAKYILKRKFNRRDVGKK